MKIAVIDDNEREADLLLHFIQQYKTAFSYDITAYSFPSGEAFLSTFCESEYDVVFLDIFMEKIDGIETARHLWERDPQCLIVFLTVSQEHIWQAAQIHFFDYIDKKDFNRQRIFRVLSDLRKKLPQLDEHLDFVSGNRHVRLSLNRIQHILSDNNYTVFSMEDGQEQRYRVPFGSILKLIKDVNYFLLCNRGILLNMNHIIREETDVYVMKNGQRFPIRKADRTAIRHTYHQYQFEKLDSM